MLRTSNMTRVFGVASALFASAGQAQVLAADGFEDGDRDNDGVLEGAANNVGDTGFVWYLAGGTTDATAGIVDDAAGLGSGNALQFTSNTTSNRTIAAAFPEVTLEEGDQISFAFDFRIEGPVPVTDRRVRFGIHSDGGTPLTEDGFEESRDDPGYMVQLDTGVADGTTATLRGDLPNGLLTGSTRSLSASTSNPADAITDNSPRRYEIRVRRSFDASLGRDVNIVTFIADGVLVDDGIDDDDPGVLTNTFNQIAIGANPIEGVEYRIDNVEVTLIPAALPTGDISDGFEDGDRDNNGTLEGPVNDSSDVGLIWYRSRGGSSSPIVEILDDSGAGNIDSGNALNIFTISNSTRALSAAIPEVTLENPGDFVEFSFDFRMNGVIPNDAGGGFRFGIHDSMGTPIVRDGGPTLTNDDLGYIGIFDTGPSTSSTVSSRGDNDPNGWMGGTARALGSTPDDPTGEFAIDDNAPRRIGIRVERAFDSDLGRDVNLVDVSIDGVAVSQGVDDGQEPGDPDRPEDPNPVTFTFNQLSLSFNVALADGLFDNIEFVTNVGETEPCLPDVNGDGILNGADFNAWLSAFAAMDPAADQNGDGNLNGADFNAWLSNFAAGCP